jgi:hypothetical protein
MSITIAVILGLAALIIAIWSAVKPVAILWIAVVLLSILAIIEHIPLK